MTLVNRIVGSGAEAPDQLVANPANWRVHPKAQQQALGAVLDEIGWVQQVVVNQRTGFVVDGHLRVALALSRAEPEVPVLYVDLSPEEEALVLASLDPLAGMAVPDPAKLAELLAEVTIPDAELASVLEGLAGVASAAPAEEGEVPEPPDDPITKPGDLWLMGEHRLLCGDSTDPATVAAAVEDRRADCMWTDPPYGVRYVGKTKDALTIDNDDAIGLPELLAGFMAAASKVALAPGAAFYVARPPGALSLVFGRAVADGGWRLHEELQWVKDSMVLGHSDYHLRHETIMFGYLPGEGRRGRGGAGWYGDDSQTSVFEVARPKASPDHPTGKPVDLIVPMLRNSCRESVYEPFAGSGSTLIAAEETGVACTALEIDPAYCDVTVKRWENFTGNEAKRVEAA